MTVSRSTGFEARNLILYFILLIKIRLFCPIDIVQKLHKHLFSIDTSHLNGTAGEPFL